MAHAKTAHQRTAHPFQGAGPSCGAYPVASLTLEMPATRAVLSQPIPSSTGSSTWSLFSSSRPTASPANVWDSIGVCALLYLAGYANCMNTNGNVATLVASHPGNTSAVKHGAYSPRLMLAQSAEIEAKLVEDFTFSPSQRATVHEVARLTAILETIDREIDENGIVDGKGEARSILNYRSRTSRQLERRYDKISSTMDRQSRLDAGPASDEDFARELEWIALGHDPNATPRDRIRAHRALSSLTPPSKPQAVTAISIPLITNEDGTEEAETLSEEEADAITERQRLSGLISEE